MQRLNLSPLVLRIMRYLRKFLLLFMKHMLTLNFCIKRDTCACIVKDGLHWIRWLDNFVQKSNYFIESPFVQLKNQANKLNPVFDLQQWNLLTLDFIYGFFDHCELLIIIEWNRRDIRLVEQLISPHWRTQIVSPLRPSIMHRICVRPDNFGRPRRKTELLRPQFPTLEFRLGTDIGAIVGRRWVL
jgi:hypothetical protein